ncbi:winged helix-turn-helix transcriptional regulator [Actinokineospora diospyrosa]|uniref:winged helix-turn-helix transcriptional regulator n=1 Tax=Actinokineospora diospyrosa TaxID=103728 RepID=UPI0020A4632F|nr:winged helix-turn-helix transcriptional regulator [Actinokineospora diospyrosa]
MPVATGSVSQGNEMAGKRDYGQFCGLAAGLNIIGERWTLLLVRELLVSALRFNELLDNLPGIGPNLLAERLRTLAEHGLVEQLAVVGDGRAKRYRLTERGQQLRGPVLGLARWGMQFLSLDDRDGGEVRAEWGIIAVQAMVDTGRVPEVDEAYEFRVGEETFGVFVDAGAVRFVPGPPVRAEVVVSSDPDTFIQIGAGMVSPFDALAAGQIKLEGPAEAIRRCTRMLGLT